MENGITWSTCQLSGRSRPQRWHLPSEASQIKRRSCLLLTTLGCLAVKTLTPCIRENKTPHGSVVAWSLAPPTARYATRPTREGYAVGYLVFDLQPMLPGRFLYTTIIHAVCPEPMTLLRLFFPKFFPDRPTFRHRKLREPVHHCLSMSSAFPRCPPLFQVWTRFHR